MPARSLSLLALGELVEKAFQGDSGGPLIARAGAGYSLVGFPFKDFAFS